MRIVLNGTERQIADATTIAALLKELDLIPDRVAVEINLEIIDRADFGQQILQDGDRVEVIGFVGGGEKIRHGI